MAADTRAATDIDVLADPRVTQYWDGDGITTLGLYSARGEFLLRNSNVAGPPQVVLTLGVWGSPVYLPLAGAWGGKP